MSVTPSIKSSSMLPLRISFSSMSTIENLSSPSYSAAERTTPRRQADAPMYIMCEPGIIIGVCAIVQPPREGHEYSSLRGKGVRVSMSPSFTFALLISGLCKSISILVPIYNLHRYLSIYVNHRVIGKSFGDSEGIVR